VQDTLSRSMVRHHKSAVCGLAAALLHRMRSLQCSADPACHMQDAMERCSLFLPLRWGAGPMALMLWLNLVI
jgi:hypothetical protein